MIDAARQFYKNLKAVTQRHRLWFLMAALLVFVFGAYYSVQSLELKPSSISYLPLLLALAITSPMSILLNAVEFILCGRAVGQRIKVLSALKVSTGATIANVLPFPAGLAMRGGALVAGGASLSQATQILMVAGLMWVVLAATFSGVALTSGGLIGVILGASAIAVTGLFIWVHTVANVMIAVGFVLVRTGMLVLLTFQLKLCFSALGLNMSFGDAAIYVVAGIAGLVVTIAPAGLGVVEAVGASLAEFAGASPSGAFLALSVSRVIGLVVSGAIVIILLFVPLAGANVGQKADDARSV